MKIKRTNGWEKAEIEPRAINHCRKCGGGFLVRKPFNIYYKCSRCKQAYKRELGWSHRVLKKINKIPPLKKEVEEIYDKRSTGPPLSSRESNRIVKSIHSNWKKLRKISPIIEIKEHIQDNQ